MSERIRKLWADPAYRERVVGGMREKLRSDGGRRPLSVQHRERIRESLLLYNDSQGRGTGAEKEERLARREEQRRLALEKKRLRREARERKRKERMLIKEQDRVREVVRSQRDKSLVEVLQSGGILPTPEKPGRIDPSMLSWKLDSGSDDLPEIHLDFESQGDHVTTVGSMRKKARGRKSDDLSLDGVQDSELQDDDEDDDDDDDEDDDDDDYDESWDMLDEERLRYPRRSSSRKQVEEVKKNVIVYIDGCAYRVDEATGEKTLVNGAG